jgi:hypothetical protein
MTPDAAKLGVGCVPLKYLGAFCSVALAISVAAGCDALVPGKNGKARTEVQAMYNRLLPGAVVPRCRFSDHADEVDSNASVYRCEVEVPRCTRSFLFYVPRADIDGARDANPEPRLQHDVFRHPCRVRSDPRSQGGAGDYS